MRKMFSENQIKNIVNQGIESGEILKYPTLTSEHTQESNNSIALNDEEKNYLKNGRLFYIRISDNSTDYQYISYAMPNKVCPCFIIDDNGDFNSTDLLTILSDSIVIPPEVEHVAIEIIRLI